MYKIKAAIEGTAPLLMNAFSEAAKEILDTGKTGGKRTSEQKMAEVEDKQLKNKDGLFIPSYYIRAAMRDGSKMDNMKLGKKGLAPYLEALVFIEPREISLQKLEYDFIDARIGRRPPRTGAAVLIRRPGIKEGWMLEFVITVASDIVPEVSVKEALQAGGLYCGLGDGRKMGFGKFQIIKWEIA